MTLEDFLNKYKDVEITSEQEKTIKDCLGIKDNKRWKAKLNENYYFIQSDGSIDDCNSSDGSISNYRHLSNNMFKTREDAEFRAKQIDVYNELKNYAINNNEVIDWYNPSIPKYYITYNYNHENLTVCSHHSFQSIGQIYFSSAAIANAAIDDIGKNYIKKYLFGIE